MIMKKKYLAGVVIVSLVFLILAGAAGMSAYFSDEDTAVNTFYVDKNEIAIEEEFEKPEKGKKTVKKPVALNTGNTECYVRVMVLLSDSRASDYLNYYYNDDLGFNTSDWITNGDGWMYYNDTLEKGERTSPVFTHIELVSSIPDMFMDFTIDVVFESVQSTGYNNAKAAFDSLAKGGGI